MRNLIAFLRRFRVFLLFAVLQIFALSTYFSFLNFPRTQYLTTASIVTGKVLKVRNDVTKHFNLSKNNLALQKENIFLRSRLPQSFQRLQNGLVKIDDTLFQQQYTYIPAEVINSSTNRMNNYFTLNIGSLQGVKRRMGVFSENGIVGIIHTTSEHYSIVKTVLTENINVDVVIEPMGIFGLLKWDGRDARYGMISGISNDFKIKKWSKVVTRGGSGIFPKGLHVGNIYKLEPVEGKPLWNVIIKFSEDYRALQRVYIVKNLLLEEQEKLELTIPADKKDE